MAVTRAAALLLAAALLAAPAGAQTTEPPASACFDAANTIAITDCLAAETRTADQQLNAAYKALLERIEPEQHAPLKAAQRLWIQYRDANCGFYAAQSGSIRQIEAAECLRSMTADRAVELSDAMIIY